MLISVIVAAYNREKYIADTLKSIQAQTFKDFECLIVDDNSTDSTVNIILEQFCKKDKRFKLYVNCTDNSKKHLNDKYAVDVLFNLPETKYTVHVDSDDIFDRNMISRLVDEMERHPEYDACCADIAVLRHTKDLLIDLNYLEKNAPVPADSITRGHDARTWEDEQFNVSPGYIYAMNCRMWNNQCYIAKTSMLKHLAALNYFENIPYGDYIFWCNAIAEGYRLHKIKDILCYYRISGSNTSNNDNYCVKELQTLYIYNYSRTRMILHSYHNGGFAKINIIPGSVIPWYIERTNSLKKELIEKNEWDLIPDRYKEELVFN